MNWKTLMSGRRSREHSNNWGNADRRTEFQKDYQRIIQSASFRRLQDKTQVFPLDKSDFVRTRLTHSLEVSSFAKSLGQIICRCIMEEQLDGEMDLRMADDICCVLECSGLIHDIGNPPFGHFGEDYIRWWFRKNLPELTFEGRQVNDLLTDRMKADLMNFEGNAQALRLLTKLHFLVGNDGMNLNYALLNTIIKYPNPSTAINKHSGNVKDKKMGYYYSEESIFRSITESTGAGNMRHPLVYILEAADDIAYKTADIEDAVIKGFITYSQLLEELRSEKYTSLCADSEEREAYDDLVNGLVRAFAQAKENGAASPEQNAVQRWIVIVQGMLLRCAGKGFTDNYRSIMDGTFTTDIISASHGNAIAAALGDIAYRLVFISKPIYTMEIAEGNILEHLLSGFVSAVLTLDSDQEPSPIDRKYLALISQNYMRAYRLAAENADYGESVYLRLMLVTDYICGMTDSFARDLYLKLSGNAVIG